MKSMFLLSMSLRPGLVASLSLAFASVVSFSCDQGKKIDSLGAVSIKVSPTSGNDQLLPPGSKRASPIVFTFKDTNNQPLIGQSVSYYLLDTTEASEVNEQKLFVAIESGKRYLSDDPTSRVAEYIQKGPNIHLGEIESADSTTDNSGQAKVFVKPSEKYNKRITVAAIAGEKGGTVYSLGFTHIFTDTFGNSENIEVTTTNLLRENASAPFAISIAIKKDGKTVDVLGNIELELNLSLDNPDSMKDIEHNLPLGTTTCLFEQGRCRLPDNYYVYGEAVIDFTRRFI